MTAFFLFNHRKFLPMIK